MTTSFGAKSLTALLLTSVAAGLLAATPAEAKRRPQHHYSRYEVVYDTSWRKPRYVVRPRSFLDPGNEVLPYSQHYTDYAFPPGYTAYSSPNLMAPRSYWRQPLPAPFEAGYNGAW
jgi:hypothetical protein